MVVMSSANELYKLNHLILYVIDVLPQSEKIFNLINKKITKINVCVPEHELFNYLNISLSK